MQPEEEEEPEEPDPDLMTPDNEPPQEMAPESTGDVSDADQEKATEAKMAASEAASNGDRAKAIEHFTVALKLMPSALTYAKRAECYLKLKKPNAAVRDCDKALDAVLAISRDLSAAPTLRALLCATLRAAATLARAQQAVIYLTGEDDGSMLIVLFPQDELGTRDRSELEVLRLPYVGPGVAGHVLRSGAAARVDSAQEDSRFSAEVD